MPIGIGATIEIDSEFGEPPIIDGYIDLSVQEWSTATKNQAYLDDLPIDLWVMQTDQNLYIAIQLDLLPIARNSSEFIGLIISNSSSESIDDFFDAKIIQFSNISENTFNYFDYYINNSIFLNDTVTDGDGAAKLEDGTSTYEFSIPIDGSFGSEEDASLDFDKSFAFNVTYGIIPSYPSGVRKSSTILINIAPLPTTKPLPIRLTFFVLVIIVFSILGVLYLFYILKIIRLKEKIERIKR